jgi:signal transduction histidine kinase
LLIGINVGLVLAAVIGVLVGSLALLRSIAHEQALARVELGGLSASRAIEHSGEEVLAWARVLAERPTLSRLLASGAASELSGFLDRFRATGRLTSCTVTVHGAAVARSGPSPPPEALTAETADGRIVVPGEPGGPPVLVAWAAVPGAPEARVVVSRAMDEAYAREIGAEVGLDVMILDPSRAAEFDVGERSAVRAAALDAQRVVSEHLRASGLYVSALPLPAPGRNVAGLLEVSLPTTEVDSALGRFARQLLVLSLVLAGVATAISFLLARRLAGPLRALSEASVRIGKGDLATPIPRAGGAEVGRLAAAMEEMQGRLLRLVSEQRRRQGEAEAVLTGIVEGVFAVDRERRIRYLNPQAARLLGVRAEDAVGRFCGDLLNPEGPGGRRPCDESCPILDARFRQSAHASETLRLADGRRRTVVVTSAAPAAAEPSAAADPWSETRQFQVMRDETEVETTRRLRDTVLANISHEFRTPLSAQIASIELLLDRLADLSPEEVRRLLLSLERGAHRLTQLIDNLLESVRIEAGRVSIRRQPIALDEIVEAAVELTGYLMDQRGQKIEIDLPHPMPPITGDPPRLTQVFVNLLANANKFAPEGSTVRIGGRTAGSEVLVWVEDEGPGLPPDAGASLFARFVRSPGEEPAESGLGLGLYIVKSIVERHGGRVVAGEGQGGRGTRMSLALPREPRDEDPRR